MHSRAAFGLVAAMFVGSGCKEFKGIEIDARALIPKEATMAAGFEVEPIRKSAAGEPIHAAMKDDGDVGPMLIAIPKCKLDTTTMRGFIATTMDDDDKFLAVIEAPGIGDKDMVRCLEKEIGEASGEGSGLILFETKGKVLATPQEGGGFLITLNKNSIAIVDQPWEDEVFAAIENESARNTDSVVAKAAAEIDPSTDVWVAYAPSDGDRADLRDVPGASDLQGLSVLADLSEGLKLDARFTFPDADKAKAFGDGLGPLLSEMKPMLAGFGLPAKALDAVKPEQKDAIVSLGLTVDATGFPKVVEALGQMAAE